MIVPVPRRTVVPWSLRSVALPLALPLVPALTLALALAISPVPVPAEDRIDVSGRVVAWSPEIVVSLTLTNRGAAEAAGIEVTGELAADREATRLAGTLAPGASADVALTFAGPPPRPGLHALTLLVEHPLAGSPDAGGNPPVSSRRVSLPLAIGVQPEPAVSLAAAPLALDVRGSLAVRLASRDAAPHRVRLRALAARGLRVEAGPLEVAVPAAEPVVAEVEVVRAGAPRGSRQELLLVAETLDGPLARDSVATATVEVREDPGLLPLLRGPIVAAGVALLAIAIVYEVRSRTRGRVAGKRTEA